MRVDFYQLSHDPVGVAVAKLAANAMAVGERMLVVCADGERLQAISAALWAHPRGFLAHGMAGTPDDARQPILLSQAADPANDARFVVLADGQWRDEALTFARTFFVFDDMTLQAARQQWRELGQRDGVERKFWKQEDGKWVQAA